MKWRHTTSWAATGERAIAAELTPRKGAEGRPRKRVAPRTVGAVWAHVLHIPRRTEKTMNDVARDRTHASPLCRRRTAALSVSRDRPDRQAEIRQLQTTSRAEGRRSEVGSPTACCATPRLEETRNEVR